MRWINLLLKRIRSNFLNRKFRGHCIAGKVTFFNCAKVINNLRVREAIQVGDFSMVKGELLTFAHGGEIRVGKYCFIGESTRIWSAKKISIGDRVLISHNVNIFDSLTHPINARIRHLQYKEILSGQGHPETINGLNELSVHIEDDVWIACQSVILHGVTIGRGSVVAAGSVVTKDVPAWSVVAGNPARVIREIPESER